jgi:hypothetical protein
MSNLFEIMFSVAGAEAVTGSMENIMEKSGELGGELMRLAGVAGTLGASMEGLKSAMEVGSAMTILAARTGETVESLVVMQRAFETSGIGADMMGIMVNRLQKAISGVNEMGKNTKGAFAALGLTPEQLQGLGFDEQLKKLADGFQRIHDPAQRAAIAMDLFGREGGQMLMLLTKAGLLTEAGDDVGRYAERMQDLAPKFHDVENKLSLMKDRLKEMWAVALEQLLPVLSKIGDLIKGLNLAPLGSALGSGGAIALAAGLTSSLASKLNTVVMAWATNPSTSSAATSFAERFILPLTGGLTSFFSVALPALIVVAVGGAIIAAIAEGLREHNDNVQNARMGAYTPLEHARESIKGVGSRAEETTVKAGIAADLKKAEDRLAELDAKQKAIDAANNPLDPAKLKGASLSDILSASLSSGPTPAEFGGDAGAKAPPLVAPMSEAEMAEMTQLRDTVKGLRRDIETPVKQGLIDDVAATRANAQYKNLGESLAKLHGEARQAAEEAEQDHQKKLAMLQEDRKAAVAKGQTPDTGLDAADAEAKHLGVKLAVDAIDKQITEEEKKTTDEKKKQEEHAAKIYELSLQIKINEAHAAGKTDQESALKAQLAGIQAGRAAIGAGADPGQALALAYQAANAAQAEADAHKAGLKVQQDKEALMAAITAKQEDLDAVENNYALSANEKWAKKKQIIADTLVLYDAYLAHLKKEADDATAKGDKPTAAIDTKALDEGNNGEKGIKKQDAQLGPDPNNFAANWTDTLTKLRSEWELTAKTIASSMGGVLSSMQSGLSSAIEGMANRTKTLGQAFWTVAGSISQSFIKAASDMVAKWTMQHVVMAGISRLFNAQEIAGHAMTETTKTVVTTSAAGIRTTVRTTETVESVGLKTVEVGTHVAGEALKTESAEQGFIIRIALKIKEALASVYHGAVEAFTALAGIPYVGPILAGVAMAAALVGGIRLVSQIGHAEGGHIVGSGGPTDDQVPALLSNGEWVAPAWQVNHPVYGPMIASLEAARRGTATFALGGLTSPQYFSPSITRPAYAPAAGSSGGSVRNANSSAGAQQAPPVYILMDEKDFARKMQEHSEAWFQRQHASAMRKG